jgi:hypothetical protein
VTDLIFRVPEDPARPTSRAVDPALSPTLTYPPEVQQYIDQYRLLNDREYRNVVADAVFEGEQVELAALHSDELIVLTSRAVELMVKEVNNQLNNPRRDKDVAWRRRATTFRDVMGEERRLAKALVDNLSVRMGRASNAPNASSRALRELAKRHPVEYIELRRKHKANIAAEAAAAKAERQAERRRLQTPS